MNILGIETSCDETAAAVVKDGTKILADVVASSAEMHAVTGELFLKMQPDNKLKALFQ